MEKKEATILAVLSIIMMKQIKTTFLMIISVMLKIAKNHMKKGLILRNLFIKIIQ